MWHDIRKGQEEDDSIYGGHEPTGVNAVLTPDELAAETSARTGASTRGRAGS